MVSRGRIRSPSRSRSFPPASDSPRCGPPLTNAGVIGRNVSSAGQNPALIPTTRQSTPPGRLRPLSAWRSAAASDDPASPTMVMLPASVTVPSTNAHGWARPTAQSAAVSLRLHDRDLLLRGGRWCSGGGCLRYGLRG